LPRAVALVASITWIILVCGVPLLGILLAVTALRLTVLLAVPLWILLPILLAITLGDLLSVTRLRAVTVLAVTALPLVVTSIGSVPLVLSRIPVSVIALPEGGPSYNQESH